MPAMRTLLNPERSADERRLRFFGQLDFQPLVVMAVEVHLVGQPVLDDYDLAGFQFQFQFTRHRQVAGYASRGRARKGRVFVARLP